MKNSKRMTTLVIVAMVMVFATNVKAQIGSKYGQSWRLGVGIEGGIPTGNLNNFSNFELGGTVRLQYDAASNLSYTLTSGYYNVFAKSIPTGASSSYTPNSLGIVPLKAGIKYFPTENIYLSGELGAGFETNYAKNTKLILAPGVGYANDSGLDIGLRYENFSGQSNNYGLVALRLAYGFKL